MDRYKVRIRVEIVPAGESDSVMFFQVRIDLAIGKCRNVTRAVSSSTLPQNTLVLMLSALHFSLKEKECFAWTLGKGRNKI